jgi:hypothetical protein
MVRTRSAWMPMTTVGIGYRPLATEGSNHGVAVPGCGQAGPMPRLLGIVGHDHKVAKMRVGLHISHDEEPPPTEGGLLGDGETHSIVEPTLPAQRAGASLVRLYQPVSNRSLLVRSGFGVPPPQSVTPGTSASATPGPLTSRATTTILQGHVRDRHLSFLCAATPACLVRDSHGALS